MTNTKDNTNQSFQARVAPWMEECFGDAISNDKTERNHRFLEESLELVQSLGLTTSEAHKLVDYVFSRPVGEPQQEVGGTMVTLAALCLASDMNMHDCAEAELTSIFGNVEKIRTKNLSKPKHQAKLGRVFVDMDGVMVDFELYMSENNLTAEEVKNQPGAYFAMKPIEGALKAISEMTKMGYDVWVATKPPTGVSHAYGDKAAWIFDRIPELKKKIVITHDKGFLGNYDDFLVDDRLHKASCHEFSGTLIPFVDGKTWTDVLKQLREHKNNILLAEDIAIQGNPYHQLW